MKKMIDELNILSGQQAIAGNEFEVTDYLKKELKSDYYQDRLGSVIATKGTGSHILITAPVDEVGLIVSQVKPNGLIGFQNVGFMHAQNSINQLFMIRSTHKKFLAHLVSKPLNQQEQVLSFKDMYLDAGFNSSKAVFESGIQIGDMVTRYSPLQVMEDRKVIGKALESRVPVYILKSVIESAKDLNVKLHAAFTVQHKMSMKGAKTSSFMVEPEVALSLDTVNAQDYDGQSGVLLGGGPVITFYDKGLIAHPKLKNFIIELCKKHQIPYQEAYQLQDINEGHYLQLTKLGTATLAIGIPIRNKHAHHQMVDLNDILHTKKLLELTIKNLNQKTIDTILYDA